MRKLDLACCSRGQQRTVPRTCAPRSSYSRNPANARTGMGDQSNMPKAAEALVAGVPDTHAGFPRNVAGRPRSSSRRRVRRRTSW